MNTKTIQSKQVWQSPDGQKKIWEVVLEANGKQYGLKTFSPRISEVGFEGDVESYENPRGDRFVKQAPRPAYAEGSTSPNGSGRGNGYYRDDSAIRAQWAIGQAVQVTGRVTKEGKALDMDTLEDYAKELFVMVDRVRGNEPISSIEQVLAQQTTETQEQQAELFGQSASGSTDAGITYEAIS